MKREDFLQHVAEAAWRGLAHRVRPSTMAFPTAAQSPTHLCRQFCDELTKLQVEHVVVANHEAAMAQVETWFADIRPAVVDLSDSTLQERARFEEVVKTAGARLAETVADQLAADVSITGVDWAISSTGTLVMGCGETRSRVSPIGADCHIAVVQERQMVHDLNDLAEIWDEQFNEPKSWPANLLMITGPSKTGDIEMKLTQGVHGPGRLLVLVVGNDSISAIHTEPV